MIKDLEGSSKHQGRMNLGNVMDKSKRSYKHIHIRAQEIGEEELRLLFRNEWQSAVLSISEVKSSPRLIKYISMFMPSLTTLKLSIANIRKVVNPDHKLDIHNLKSLTFSQCSSSVLEVFVRDECNNSLQDLNLSAIRQSILENAMKASRIFENLMEKFEALIRLDIGSSGVADDIFKYDISEFTKFHLKEFRVVSPSSPVTCGYIEKFLMSQGSTLVDVCLLSWNQTETIYTIWNEMRMLKFFHMSGVQPSSIFGTCNVSLIKKRLKHLSLHYADCEITHEYLKPLLRSLFLMDEITISTKTIKVETLDLLKTAARKVAVNGETVFRESDDGDDEGITDNESSEFSSDSSVLEMAVEEIDTIEIDSD